MQIFPRSLNKLPLVVGAAATSGLVALVHPGWLLAEAAGALLAPPARRAARAGLPVLPRQRRAGSAGHGAADGNLHELPPAREDRLEGPRADPRQLADRKADGVDSYPQAP